MATGYEEFIRNTASELGVDPDYMVSVAKSESGLNPKVKPSDTGARGLFQFMPKTWQGMISRYGPRYGYTAETSPDDPEANTRMAAHYTQEAKSFFQKRYQRAPSRGEMYTMHFLGPEGAQAVFDASPDETMDKVSPKVYVSSPTNKSAMSNPDGTPLTVAQFRSKFEKQGGATGRKFQMATMPRANIPQVLGQQSQGLGDLIGGDAFVSDTPPQDENELAARFQEMQAYLRQPNVKAGLIQMAIASFQPRNPGQTTIGHLANAAGYGGEASARQEAQTEAYRQADVAESQRGEHLQIQRDTLSEASKDRAERLKIQRDTLSEASKDREDRRDIAREGLSVQWAKLADEEKRFNLAVTREQNALNKAEGQQRNQVLLNITKLAEGQVKRLQEALTLDPKNEQLKQQLIDAQRTLNRYQSAYEKAVQGMLPEGVELTKPRVDLSNDAEKYQLWATRNPKKLGELYQSGEIDLSEEQRQDLQTRLMPPEQRAQMEDAKRVIPRPPSTTGEQLKEGAGSLIEEPTRFIGRNVGVGPGSLPGRIEKALTVSGNEIPQDSRTIDRETQKPIPLRVTKMEFFKKLDKKTQDRIIAQIDELLGDKPPSNAEDWKALLSSEVVERIARKVYGNRVVDQAKKDLADTGPRATKASTRRQSIREELDR